MAAVAVVLLAILLIKCTLLTLALAVSVARGAALILAEAVAAAEFESSTCARAAGTCGSKHGPVPSPRAVACAALTARGGRRHGPQTVDSMARAVPATGSARTSSVGTSSCATSTGTVSCSSASCRLIVRRDGHPQAAALAFPERAPASSGLRSTQRGSRSGGS